MKTIKLVLEEFERFVLKSQPEISGFHPYFQKAFWEMLCHGGKRFRPALLFSVVLAYDKEAIKRSFLPALALECFHTYSLIHDDLPCMDNADLRRGHPTLHKTYDETAAVLIGDGLNTYAFELLCMAEFPSEVKVGLIHTLAQAGGISGMILGQALDCHFEKQILSFEKLQFIHHHKTAKLIAASLKMGGIIAQLSQDELMDLEQFGWLLGLYFQVRDDIIDCTQPAQSAGKSTKNDGAKNSYVNLLGLHGARTELGKLKAKILEEMQDFDLAFKDILNGLLQRYFEEI